MFPTVSRALVLSVLIAGCGDGDAEPNTDDQGDGSCYVQSNNDGPDLCISWYGVVTLPSQNESHCALWGGQWSNQDCPDGFWGTCDLELVSDSGTVTHYYGGSQSYAEGSCEAAGGGVWKQW